MGCTNSAPGLSTIGVSTSGGVGAPIVQVRPGSQGYEADGVGIDSQGAHEDEARTVINYVMIYVHKAGVLPSHD